MTDRYDAIVIGGGAAGLSGALTLARARRRVVVIDDGRPRNAPADAIHGLLGNDGTPPAELLARGRGEVLGYGGEIVTARVESARALDGGDFAVRTSDGAELTARRLLVTTGLVDELPELEGMAEHWGDGVIHCPYCHGHEVGDGVVGVLATSPMSIHQALLFRQWTPNVRFLANGLVVPTEDLERFAARGIEVVEPRPLAVRRTDDRLTGVELENGTHLDLDALVVAPVMVARASFLADLGLTTSAFRMGDHVVGERLEVDAMHRTSVAGVWAAGNVTDLSAQVGAASAAGVMAAAQLNADLVFEDTDAAVREHRAGAVAGVVAGVVA